MKNTRELRREKNREKINQQAKERRAKNKEKVREIKKRHYRKNKSDILAKQRAYMKERRKNNPEKCRLYAKKRTQNNIDHIAFTKPFAVQAKCYKNFGIAQAIQTLKSMPDEDDYRICHVKISRKDQIADRK